MSIENPKESTFPEDGTRLGTVRGRIAPEWKAETS